ncbi:MAG: 3-methyl-2-oxobutanoate hydroxymethyltransferase [Cyanobacteria bacterium]|nr:3-methyl-2-oxobutanoate hydroxymethyltransferase [Cyanobacteriota bacterium]
MSIASKTKAITPISFQKYKITGQKIISLTCYDYTTAKILDQSGVDFLLVGDSLAMTVLGHPNTLSITVDEMLHHVKAVSKGASHALVVADMPFMSYQVDFASAVKNAGRFVQEGHAGAIKLEGATPLTLSIVEHLSHIGIPVMGHLGFTPQSIQTLGGFKVQGKRIEDARNLLDEAKMLEAAGAFAVVLEMVPVEVASLISQQIRIPTIGIGSGNGCDGQILVVDDFLGRYQDFKPRFVRHYGNFSGLIQEAVHLYREDIQSGQFPDNDLEAFRFDTLELPELHLAMMGE